MKLSPDNIDKILCALEQQISLRSTERVTIVVCGGTALAMLDLVPRTTKDVDVLAWARETGDLVELERIHGFPDWLEESASVVARDFGLARGWFNAGPSSQLDLGLPDGFEKRLTRREFGHQLTVYVTGRRDQIFFKLFPAVDRNDYHTQDLQALAPTDAEMLDAARWVVTQDVSEPFRMLLEDFLVRYGNATVADQL
jgi:hypothetical protein